MAQYSVLGEFSQRALNDDEEQNGNYAVRNNYPGDELFLEKTHCLGPKLPFYRQYYKSFAVNAILLTCNIIFFLVVWKRFQPKCLHGVYGPELIYTPAKDAIEFESRKWDHTNTYFRNGSINPDRLHKMLGPPSAGVDEAWAKLIRYQNIRLSREELGEFSGMSGLVEFADKSGYYATLSAYHSLHCIKRLHHYLYFDQYYPGKTELEAMLIKHHAEHCLNILLQTVQCNPDLSIFPMQWGARTRIPIGLDIGHHQCMNWKRVDEWMKERSVDVYKPGLVVHPTLGDAYINGTSDDTGIALDHTISDFLQHEDD